MKMTDLERIARAIEAAGHLGVSLAFTAEAPTDTDTIRRARVADTERAMNIARLALEAASQTALQAFHDLEIAGGIEWMYDSAWHVWIGNPKLAEANVGSEEEAMQWLRKKAAELYPKIPSPSPS